MNLLNRLTFILQWRTIDLSISLSNKLNIALMVIVETSVFTKQVQQLLNDEEYRLLQTELVKRPDAGVVIPGSGGLRKIRWYSHGHGKRGIVETEYT